MDEALARYSVGVLLTGTTELHVMDKGPDESTASQGAEATTV